MLNPKARKSWPVCHGVTIRNRHFSQHDVVFIRRQIRDHKNWGRTRLSEELCKRFDWRQPNGRLKDRACRVALLRLEALGYLKLPTRKVQNGGKPPKSNLSIHFDDAQMTEFPSELRICRVDSKSAKIWNSCIAQHHYLGLPTSVGRSVRYLAYSGPRLLSAISFGEPAWNVSSRNRVLNLLGYDDELIRKFVVCNTRFLILPGIQVRNLASHLLASFEKRLVAEWSSEFASPVHFFETFVDPKRFYGTCYKAANWIQIGQTKGFSKRGASHSRNSGSKLVYLRSPNRKLQHKLKSAENDHANAIPRKASLPTAKRKSYRPAA